MERVKAGIQTAQQIQHQLAELEKKNRATLTYTVYSISITSELLELHGQLQNVMDDVGILGIAIEDGVTDVQLRNSVFFSIVGDIEPSSVGATSIFEYKHYDAVVDDIHLSTVVSKRIQNENEEHKKAQAI